MGVSVPGRVNASGRIVFAPNLDWEGTGLRQLLERAIGLPVAIENAASACALAELWFGRQADDVRHLAALDVVKGDTLSTNTTPIVPTDPATQPRLRGAVTLAFHSHRRWFIRAESAIGATLVTTGDRH